MLHAYAAFLRGIMPHGKNMSNAQLRAVFESLGFEKVASVISSGNLVFQSPSGDIAALEKQIESALQEQLGIGGLTMLRSRAQLEMMVENNTFDGLSHSRQTYLTVSLFKDAPMFSLEDLPPLPQGSKILAIDTELKAMYVVRDTTSNSTIDFMAWVENYAGKEQTMRTWPTLQKVQTKLPV